MPERRDKGGSKTSGLRKAAANARQNISARDAHTGSHSVRETNKVRFPNEAGALRQHVAKVVEAKPQRPTIRLRREPAVVPVNRDLVVMPATPKATAKSASYSAGANSNTGFDIRSTADLGRVVQAARRHKHLTQEALARLAGTGRRFISELEAGKPTLELGRVLAVCHALGVRLTIGEQTK